MADVDIKYKGSSIASMNASGTKTLQTSGKYCEGDIEVVYADPEKPTQSKTVTPTASGFTVSPDSGKVLSSVVVNGDADLISANVRKGKNIFGVDGNMEEGITPSGIKTITENGTYDVMQFAGANVDVLTEHIVTITVVSEESTTSASGGSTGSFSTKYMMPYLPTGKSYIAVAFVANTLSTSNSAQFAHKDGVSNHEFYLRNATNAYGSGAVRAWSNSQAFHLGAGSTITLHVYY